jgi:SAM-dependent methyltransferase
MIDSILVYEPHVHLDKPEVRTRDAQAAGYLQHRKFPTQMDRLNRFIERCARGVTGHVLDLGCGPGPTTKMLLDVGFHVVAVDFSRRSLELNAERCGAKRGALFVHADLTRIRFAPNSVDGLMMADFLQHLVDAEVQRAFLERAFKALRPGGWFFLSFFNVNIKHRLNGDIVGSYAKGSMPYRRLTPREVRKMLPHGVSVWSVEPMNIAHTPRLDRLASRLPFTHALARMSVITGKRAIMP